MKKLICVLLCAAMLISGCSSEEFVFLSCDLDSNIKTLDPQFAESKSEQNIIANIFEGLVKRNEMGEELPACAEKWEITQGGTVYTFTLRDDIFWSDGEKVTADNFAFAFERMFSPDTPSPFAGRYAAVENSLSVMAGEMDKRALGVKAEDERTLVITLSAAENGFLTILAQTPAMPCRRDFFGEQMGRYGLDKRYLLTNGNFELYSWGSETVKIRRSEHHRNQALVDGVDFNLAQDDNIGRFTSGATDVCLVGRGNVESVSGKAVYDRTWALIINPASEAFTDKDIRMSVIGAVREKFSDRTPQNSRVSDGLIPPAAEIGAINYRTEVGSVPQAKFPEDARAAMLEALERLETDRIKGATLLVCDGEAETAMGGAMQRVWQDTLSAYFNMQPLNEETLTARVKSGNFDIAIAPVFAENGDKTLGLSMLSSVIGQSDEMGIGAVINTAVNTPRDTEAAKLLWEAEKRITEEYLAMPLYDTPTVFACAEDISGVWYEPATGLIYFNDAATAK